MPVPDYQSIMLPLLQFTKDGAEHRIRDAYAWIADRFGLTEEEREQLLPSGKAPLLNNRVQWAKTYLVKSGLLRSPKRGFIQITDRGKTTLTEGLEKIDVSYLDKYPEFVAFRTKQKDDDGDTGTTDEDNSDQSKTPDELLETAYTQLRTALAVELLEQVGQASPAFFEKLVVDLLVAMGYGGTMEDAGKVVGRSGDGGIDGIIKEDRLGLDAIYLQAKRWEAPVGRPEIQKFVGALQGQRAKKGIFVTTSSFTKEAKDYAANIDSKVVLIDGRRLAQLMIDFDIGVSTMTVYATKRLDTDYFAED